MTKVGSAPSSAPLSSDSPAANPASAAAERGDQRTTRTQAVLDAVLAAVKAGDRAAFDRFLASPRSRFADRLFANLTAMPSSGLELHAEPGSTELSGSWRSRHPDGWAQQVQVSTRLDHDTGPATCDVWLVMVPTSTGARLAGLGDGPGGDGAPLHRPLWLIEQIRVVTGPGASVVAADRVIDAGAWLRRAEAAERAVRARLDGAGDGRWPDGLVLELPSSEDAFDQVLGVDSGSYHQIAAVAWPEGPDAATSAVRVVVNPAAAGSLNADQLAVLITHEATHVLTRSASSPAPMWLAEGFADWVAFSRVPRAAPPTRAVVLADVRRHGAPATLPPDADFRPDADQLDLTYGRAWLLCRFIAESWSDADLVRLYAEIDGGEGEAAALANVLGVDEQTLTHRWQAWLLQHARS